MRRKGTAAVGFMAATLALAAGGGTTGAQIPATPASEAGSNREPAAVTPVARPGTEYASTARIGRKVLRRELDQLMRQAPGASGAYVYDIEAERKRKLYDKSAGTRRLLASNTKVFTTAAALARFGPSFRMKTGVWARGNRSGRGDRKLKGNLYLVGDGDPALSSHDFANRNGLPKTTLGRLVNKVRAAGIRVVDGNVVADAKVFDGKSSVPQTGITGGPYLSPLSGLSFNSGYGSRGSYADQPAKVAAQRFRRALEKGGVDVRGKVVLGDSRRFRKRVPAIGHVKSPPISTLIAEVNKPSNNFFAEMLLKRLGAGGERRGSTQVGANRAEAFARSVGSGASIENGSGLSRRNVASPREVAKLLVAMENDPDLDTAFRSSLAVAGRDGTLANRMRGSAAEGECRGKTGTINGVSALSGYCGGGKRRVAFSILMNGVGSTSAAQSVQDRMVAAIARYR